MFINNCILLIDISESEDIMVCSLRMSGKLDYEFVMCEKGNTTQEV